MDGPACDHPTQPWKAVVSWHGPMSSPCQRGREDSLSSTNHQVVAVITSDDERGRRRRLRLAVLRSMISNGRRQNT